MNKIQANDEYAQAFVELCRNLKSNTVFIYTDFKDILPSSNALLKMRGNGWIKRVKAGSGARPTTYMILPSAHEAAMRKASDPAYQFVGDTCQP
jgi:hypothetical protein